MEPSVSTHFVTSPSQGQLHAEGLLSAEARHGPDSFSHKHLIAMHMRRARTGPGRSSVNGALNGNSTAPLGPAGTRNEYKRVDYMFNSQTGNWIYRDTAPFTGQEAGTDDGYRDYCFIVKKTYEFNTSKSVTSIVIKSEILRDICAKVIGVIPPVSFHTPEVDVNPRILLTYYPALLAYLETLEEKAQEDDVKVKQLELLLEHLGSEYKSELEQIPALLEHAEITFDLLWAILIPNKEYYTTDHRTGQPRAVILKWATQKYNSAVGPYFDLDCEYLESFGNSVDNKSKQQHKKFAMAKHNAIIYGFQGAVKITSLNIFALEYHPRIDETRSLLITRGKKWAAYDGKHHVSYSGIAFQSFPKQNSFMAVFGSPPVGEMKRLYISGRAMIDKATFRRVKSNWPGMGLPKHSTGLEVQHDEDKYPDKDRPIAETWDQVLRDEELVLATPIVYGFSLEQAKWCELDIDMVEEIVWNDAAFANLVIPEDKKGLIQALVEAHSEKDRIGFDDFIVGKGKGLVINLFGPPGVGKTMSAEATSEHLRKPLYVIGAGHLGTSAPVLDTSLTEICDIAHAWNAVVLIDEADVFLEERSVRDINRNALVAVFLRHLEYFVGILFLTTNRVSTFDHAFQSRIHVALRYHDLDEETRSTIWKAFLAKVGAADAISAEEWQALVGKKVNGRQIKNTVRTAQALAHIKKEDLSFRHLNQALGVMDQFEADLKSLKVGMTYELDVG